MHALFLHFYLALSSESIARVTHPLSITKIKTLEQAKCSYEVAASLLPVQNSPSPAAKLDLSDDESESSSSADDEAGILDYYRSSSGTSSLYNGESSSSSIDSDEEVSMKPPPLRIRKSFTSPSEHSPGNRDDLSTSWPWPTSPATQLHPPIHTQPDLEDSDPSTPPWPDIDPFSRFNEHVFSFAIMLHSHILTTETLIKLAKEAQSQRYFSKRLASYGEDETAKAADLKSRIVRLKAKGWERERFVPERYQRLCERALDELGD